MTLNLISKLSQNERFRAEAIPLPKTLSDQFRTLRKYLWRVKISESIWIFLLGTLLALIVAFVLDRLWETPLVVRAFFTVWFVGATLCVPWAFYRWVWRVRRNEQLAQLVTKREPRIGDQLRSVIELSRDSSGESGSLALRQAAICQVADRVSSIDLRELVPVAPLPSLGKGLLVVILFVSTLGIYSNRAVQNTFIRFVAPWRKVSRFTFTQIEPVHPTLIVPHGESTDLSIFLSNNTRWSPDTASFSLGERESGTVDRVFNSYAFKLPPIIEGTHLHLSVGDFFQTIEVVPTYRPEIVSIQAEVSLPEYLGRAKTETLNLLSGVWTSVSGSCGVIRANISEPLQSASINEQPISFADSELVSPKVDVVDNAEKLTIRWLDHHGLDGKKPFSIAVTAIPDQAPVITAPNLPHQSNVLESEQINFNVFASDDFGVKRVGLSWQTSDGTQRRGERLLWSGNPLAKSVELTATFNAESFEIPGGTIAVELWAEDYLPTRKRSKSATYFFYVLSDAEHANWMYEKLSDWYQASLSIRDRERMLHHRNKELREMSQNQSVDSTLRESIEQQAIEENSSARQLAVLTKQGEELLRAAARNSEIDAKQLAHYAETLQTMNDISLNRMPSVAELLKNASQNTVGNEKESIVGQNRLKSASSTSSVPTASDSEPLMEPLTDSTLPSLVDQESSESFNGIDTSTASPKPTQPTPSRLEMAMTTVAGSSKTSATDKESNERNAPTMNQEFDEAIEEQAEILRQFDAVEGELSQALLNLERSTLVKRLKALSRDQLQIADGLGSMIEDLFGREPNLFTRDKIESLGKVESELIIKMREIMNDIEGYFERRNNFQFKLVLEEMKQMEVLESLNRLAKHIGMNPGMAMIQADFWTDTFDRWADELVIQGDEKSRDDEEKSENAKSLPPVMILEILRILEAEVNLREATRVAEQAKEAISFEQYSLEAVRLSNTQSGLQKRSDLLSSQMESLPEGRINYEADLNLLRAASQIMNEAANLLASPNTAAPAIAAETEVIELLLRSKQVNPKGGGDGGTSPEGGGGGDANQSALSLIGSGINAQEQKRAAQTRQTIGETGKVLPEEFRTGLDEYFRRIEGAIESQN